MAFIYDIMRDIHDPKSPENHLDLVAGWVLCVVRFKHRNTFDRSAMISSKGIDGSEVASEVDPLIIVSDCVNLNISKTKESVSGSLVATLKPSSQVNYTAEISPGDWVLGWITRQPEKVEEIVRRIRKREALNGFSDCLKFVGRVHSCRKRLNTMSDGKKTIVYALQAHSFKELEAQVFWDAYLAIAEPFITTWLGRLGVSLSKILKPDGMDINGTIPELLEVLLGRGIAKLAANPSGDERLRIVTGLTAGEGEAPFSFVVPETVGKLLGINSRSKTSGVLAAADLLALIMGRQKYDSGSVDVVGGFQPSRLLPLEGRFLPATPQWTGKTVWSILREYLNWPINEMYTSLRCDSTGKVVPTIVVRQLPFSSKVVKKAVQGARPSWAEAESQWWNGKPSSVPYSPLSNDTEIADDDQTFFLELPRWRIPSPAILSYDLGRSDALRFNFVHLLAQAQAHAVNNVFTWQLVNTPPVRDDLDIQRNGMRGDIQTVMTGLTENRLGAQKWMAIRADILMGQHLTLNGSLNSYLIEEPVCEGDNLELDGCVLHIESISHTASVSEDGRTRRAMTTLQLSHGVRSEQVVQDPVVSPAFEGVSDPNLDMYSMIYRNDLANEDPGVVNDRSGISTKPEPKEDE